VEGSPRASVQRHSLNFVSLTTALNRLRSRQEAAFFISLHRADLPLGVTWWALVAARSLLPALFAVAMGALVGAVQEGHDLTRPLAWTGALFILLQAVSPLHQAVGENLGNRLSAWLYDRLTEACSTPPGIGHLEDPELTGDLTVAREFDNGLAGPPMEVNLPFIATGLVDLG
jgi:ATP-binding cassette, subfamily B, bacterial